MPKPKSYLHLLFTIISSLWLGMASGQTASDSLSNQPTVYIFDIKDQIAPPSWRRTQLAFEEAQKKEVALILIHMNTYGGMLESADSIRTAILHSPIPVAVFIDNNAASAGALISIACDSIYMRRGANIGAATVVNQTGEAMPDKYQSYMRSMMRSTAEATGRDPDIAQAMVDPKIYVPGISDSNQVLTFTTSEAIRHNFCQAEAENIDAVITRWQLDNPVIVRQEISGVDKIIGFLINPFISGILIMLIIGGIYFELQTPGIGFPLGAAILAALLYFAPLYLEGLAENWEIILFVIGFALLAIEIFAIPGFGVAGVSGILLIVSGLTLSMIGNIGFDFSQVQMENVATALFVVIIAMFAALLMSLYFGKKALTTTTFGHLALDAVQEKSAGYTISDNKYAQMLGKTAIAHTILRPAGKIEIDNQVFDATSESAFIEKGTSVIVTHYQNGQLFVRPI